MIVICKLVSITAVRTKTDTDTGGGSIARTVVANVNVAVFCKSSPIIAVTVKLRAAVSEAVKDKPFPPNDTPAS